MAADCLPSCAKRRIAPSLAPSGLPAVAAQRSTPAAGSRRDLPIRRAFQGKVGEDNVEAAKAAHALVAAKAAA
jgi:hypothetical protein